MAKTIFAGNGFSGLGQQKRKNIQKRATNNECNIEGFE
jgi:hypothetical protein